MTLEQIETFLSVVETGSVSKAAEKVYRTQSSVSNRLKLLEEELGCSLFNRSKGHKSAELTDKGVAFIPIAHQWMALLNDTRSFQTDENLLYLIIGSVDIVNSRILVPLYQKIISEHRNLKLSLNTHHSGEIHTLILERSIDLGFTYSQVRYPEIVSRPILTEDMVLISLPDSPYKDGISAKELDSKNEVFLNWGPDYQIWHDSLWNPFNPTTIKINTGSMMFKFLLDNKSWGIAPYSLYMHGIDHNIPLKCCRLKESSPKRVCYMLTHRSLKESSKKAMDLFRNLLYEFIKENDNRLFHSLVNAASETNR